MKAYEAAGLIGKYVIATAKEGNWSGAGVIVKVEDDYDARGNDVASAMFDYGYGFMLNECDLVVTDRERNTK